MLMKPCCYTSLKNDKPVDCPIPRGILLALNFLVFSLAGRVVDAELSSLHGVASKALFPLPGFVAVLVISESDSCFQQVPKPQLLSNNEIHTEKTIFKRL